MMLCLSILIVWDSLMKLAPCTAEELSWNTLLEVITQCANEEGSELALYNRVATVMGTEGGITYLNSSLLSHEGVPALTELPHSTFSRHRGLVLASLFWGTVTKKDGRVRHTEVSKFPDFKDFAWLKVS